MRRRFRLYLITDRKLAAAHGGVVAAVEAALSAASTAAPPGAVALQVREKDLGARELLELARALRIVCTQHGCAMIVNDRLDVALASAADGVHLPADSFSVADARAMLGPQMLVGVSTHRPGEIAAATAAGADFAVFGPVYEPLSKSAYGRPCGGEELAAACRAASIPVYALGGITPERIRELLGSGLFDDAQPAGAAVIGAVFASKDPAHAMRQLLSALSC